MSEKSFLEILSEKIEMQIRNEISPNGRPSNNQTTVESKNEKITQNVDNYSDNVGQAPLNDTVYNQWISQIPIGKIQFSTPKQRVFGRIYPVNTPRPKPIPPRQKHVLTEKQKRSVVYFWGWQIRLQEDFTAPELKKAFRTLAHRLHPDHNNGKTKPFIELKANYTCLMSVFK